jgi:hypothetical protein
MPGHRERPGATWGWLPLRRGGVGGSVHVAGRTGGSRSPGSDDEDHSAPGSLAATGQGRDCLRTGRRHGGGGDGGGATGGICGRHRRGCRLCAGNGRIRRRGVRRNAGWRWWRRSWHGPRRAGPAAQATPQAPPAEDLILRLTVPPEVRGAAEPEASTAAVAGATTAGRRSRLCLRLGGPRGPRRGSARSLGCPRTGNAPACRPQRCGRYTSSTVPLAQAVLDASSS